jgi:BirA family transcriptional regulator, biotin operon repressor / biotin---[acetyl-CoA-carboxylase] ligase
MRETPPPDVSSALSAAADRRGCIGDPLHYFTDIGSTNDEALRLAEAGAPEGTTVVAAAQTAGRGRLGRAWFSPAGAGLYASVVIRDPLVTPLLTLAAGVALAEGVRAASALPVEIKWPNDLVVHVGLDRRRKLAGILTEASSGAAGVPFAVVGFGINLLPAAYPPEIADRTTSLAAELGRTIDAGVVLAECLAALSESLDLVRAGRTATVLTRWLVLSPSASGSRVECDGPAGRLTGVTAGVAPDGALQVRCGGRVEAIRSGVVRWL